MARWWGQSHSKNITNRLYYSNDGFTLVSHLTLPPSHFRFSFYFLPKLPGHFCPCLSAKLRRRAVYIYTLCPNPPLPFSFEPIPFWVLSLQLSLSRSLIPSKLLNPIIRCQKSSLLKRSFLAFQDATRCYFLSTLLSCSAGSAPGEAQNSPLNSGRMCPLAWATHRPRCVAGISRSPRNGSSQSSPLEFLPSCCLS